MNDSGTGRGLTGADDANWMRRYQRGDVKAFSMLLERYRRPVYTFCLRMLGERTAAEDAMQEVFLRVVKNAKEWEERAQFSTWLYTIARNQCIDMIRRSQQRKIASLDDPLNNNGKELVTLKDQLPDVASPSPETLADGAQIRSHLVQAIAALPEEQREVFLLRECAGLSFQEIARAVGALENTVKSRMRYALERLRDRLQEAQIHQPPDAGGTTR